MTGAAGRCALAVPAALACHQAAAAQVRKPRALCLGGAGALPASVDLKIILASNIHTNLLLELEPCNINFKIGKNPLNNTWISD